MSLPAAVLAGVSAVILWFSAATERPVRPVRPTPPSLDPKLGEYEVGDELRILVSYKGQCRVHIHFFTKENINWTFGELAHTIGRNIVVYEDKPKSGFTVLVISPDPGIPAPEPSDQLRLQRGCIGKVFVAQRDVHEWRHAGFTESELTELRRAGWSEERMDVH